MIRPIIIALAAAVPSIATACANLPPQQFRQEPDVKYQVYEAPADQIIAWCHKDLTYEKAHLSPNNWYDPVVEATAPNRSL